MRLRDLDARFVGRQSGSSYYEQGDTIDGAQGIIFQCPKCAVGKAIVEEDGRRGVEGAHSVLIWFANPINASVADREADPDSKRHSRWTVIGTSIDHLSLAPSVNLDVEEAGPNSCRWHGFVECGGAE